MSPVTVISFDVFILKLSSCPDIAGTWHAEVHFRGFVYFLGETKANYNALAVYLNYESEF